MKDTDIGYMLKQITDKLKVFADASFKNSGLTISQARVMQFIHIKGGRVTQKEIEEYLNVSHPTVVGIVNRLEKNGFLSCYMDTADKRNKIVSATDKANGLAEAMKMEVKAMEQRLIKSLSKSEVEELKRMLQILYHNLD